ncbi:MAG: hypothetical protein K0U37_07535 [Gammaproteobacteria bacterium]|nr:hypothetical protein [Gammaproteobacteria bacterium]
MAKNDGADKYDKLFENVPPVPTHDVVPGQKPKTPTTAKRAPKRRAQPQQAQQAQKQLQTRPITPVRQQQQQQQLQKRNMQPVKKRTKQNKKKGLLQAISESFQSESKKMLDRFVKRVKKLRQDAATKSAQKKAAKATEKERAAVRRDLLELTDKNRSLEKRLQSAEGLMDTTENILNADEKTTQDKLDSTSSTETSSKSWLESILDKVLSVLTALSNALLSGPKQGLLENKQANTSEEKKLDDQTPSQSM